MQQIKKYRFFFLLVIGQTVSQLGSGMTGFAIVIWAYTQKGNTMVSSFLAVCSMVPYLIVSLFGGTVADRFSKKKIMLVCDAAAAAGSLILLGCFLTDSLEIWILCAVNILSGLMNAFQGPASQVAITLLIDKEDYIRIGGIQSVLGSLTGILQPVLAGMLLAFGGLGLVLCADLLTFFFAFFTLLFFVQIPKAPSEKGTVSFRTLLSCTREGFVYLKSKKNLFQLVVFYCTLEFIGAIDSLISPLLLARTGNNELITGTVSSFMAVGGLIASLLLPFYKPHYKKVPAMFFGSFLCFLGIFLLGVGRTPLWFCIVSFSLSFGSPIYTTFQTVILREQIPVSMQGRIFALKSMITQALMPAGFLLGSCLADFVFTPFLSKGGSLQSILISLVGTGPGTGIGLVFVLSGFCGMAMNCLFCLNPGVRALDTSEKMQI